MRDDRRKFLRVLGATAAATTVGCPWGAKPAQGPVAAGRIDQLPMNTLRGVDDAPVVIGRDERGIWAMTTVCTHKGCNIREHGEISYDKGLHCSCHGSEFDRYGRVTHGPAKEPLVHYAVDIHEGGAIVVQAGQIVPVEQRTPVS